MKLGLTFSRTILVQWFEKSIKREEVGMTDINHSFTKLERLGCQKGSCCKSTRVSWPSGFLLPSSLITQRCLTFNILSLHLLSVHSLLPFQVFLSFIVLTSTHLPSRHQSPCPRREWSCSKWELKLPFCRGLSAGFGAKASCRVLHPADVLPPCKHSIPATLTLFRCHSGSKSSSSPS